MRCVVVDCFDDWRDASRQLLIERVEPPEVRFTAHEDRQTGLFSGAQMAHVPSAKVEEGVSKGDRGPGHGQPPHVPRDFLKLARSVSFHRDTQRWDLMYRVLWRVAIERRCKLDDVADPDVARLRAMSKEVRRDAHKMRAFVRFRRIEDDTGEHFVAWHRPDHLIVPLVADFFADRFKSMSWTILTPDQSMCWNGEELSYFEGVPRSAAPTGDELEALWKSYYRSTFNPARIKLSAMTSEMPRKHWSTLPETEVITDLLVEAPERIRSMVSARVETASPYVPDDANLERLRSAVRGCRACNICELATGPVFGEGPPDARLVLVGEQPGDTEDRVGRPFVGPAGEILDRALELAELNRDELYVTNAVKGFKYRRRGKKRLHDRPTAYETQVCKPWIAAEMRAIQPDVIVALGATAALSLTGRRVSVTRERGPVRSPFGRSALVTMHPSAILRRPEASQQAAFDALVEDLAVAREEVEHGASRPRNLRSRQ